MLLVHLQRHCGSFCVHVRDLYYLHSVSMDDESVLMTNVQSAPAEPTERAVPRCAHVAWAPVTAMWSRAVCAWMVGQARSVTKTSMSVTPHTFNSNAWPRMLSALTYWVGTRVSVRRVTR